MNRKKDPLTLPEGYALIEEIDLKSKEKRFRRLSDVEAVVFLALFFFPLVFRPLYLDLSWETLLSFLIVVVCFVLYMAIQRLIQSVLIKYYTGQKIRHSFIIPFVPDRQRSTYFSKRHFQVICFAPAVLVGLFLLFLVVVCDDQWYWPVLLLQAANISFTVKDIYLSWILRRMPADTLCNDDGLSMRFYARP